MQGSLPGSLRRSYPSPKWGLPGSPLYTQSVCGSRGPTTCGLRSAHTWPHEHMGMGPTSPRRCCRGAHGLTQPQYTHRRTHRAPHETQAPRPGGAPRVSAKCSPVTCSHGLTATQARGDSPRVQGPSGAASPHPAHQLPFRGHQCPATWLGT